MSYAIRLEIVESILVFVENLATPATYEYIKCSIHTCLYTERQRWATARVNCVKVDLCKHFKSYLTEKKI